MPHIILVDDDRTNVRLISMLLEMDGFTVEPCLSIGSAVAASANSKPDAFVVDYHLAGDEFGIELLNAIRAGQTAAPAETPVILTSGDHRQEAAALDAGANIFLLKPFSPGELSTIIKEVLQQAERNDN